MIISLLVLLQSLTSASAADSGVLLNQAQDFYKQGQYFNAARYAYAAGQGASVEMSSEGNSWVALSLVKAGLYNAATYFFIQTLQSGYKPAIKRVLTQTETLLVKVGPDLLREFLIKYTQYGDYDSIQLSAYLFTLGKAAILKADENRAIEYLNQVKPQSRLFPYALQLRGSALAIQGRANEAIEDFQDCQKYASLVANDNNPHEANDLRNRCTAGEARTLYQAERFSQADEVFDRIPKASVVWPEILFEQAWNAYARREFNRALGKLVTYKSPGLDFIYNSEIEILRSQSFLSLCLYDDVQKSAEDFEARYSPVGLDVKRFVESNAGNLESFYRFGVDTLKVKPSQATPVQKMALQFLRGPYFYGLTMQEKSLMKEKSAIGAFVRMSQSGPSGLSGFLNEVIEWRKKSIHRLGGVFIKNSFIDYHTTLIEDFEKNSFIKLEMLSRYKEKLIRKTMSSSAEEDDRARGNIKPNRRDDQFFWTFNGEFWNDELGDYVFGLESQCAQ